MREYIKTIPKYTKVFSQSDFPYKMKNQSKFIEHGYHCGISHLSPAISKYLLRHKK